MKFPTILALFALGAAVGVGAWLHGRNEALRERLAALEIAGTRAPVDAGAGEAGSAPLRGTAVRRDVAELQRTANALSTRVDSLERGASAAPGASPALDVVAWTQGSEFHDAVRAVVLDLAGNDVAFRARIAGKDRTRIPKNAPFREVAEVLQLDAAQESRMSKDLQGIQTELFALLSEERADGVVPLEMIAEAESLKASDPKRAQLFVKLFTLEIPGGGETYMQRAVKLGSVFRGNIDEYLRPAQREILDAVEVDWFSIKFD